MNRSKDTHTQGQSCLDDDFASALRSADDLFEVVAGGPLILLPSLVDPVIAELPTPRLDLPPDAA